MHRLQSLLSLALSCVAFCAGPAAAQALGPPPVPPENPLTPAKVALGKALFWDEQLSSTRTTACGTCHIPEVGGDDPRTRADRQGTTYIAWDRIPGTDDDTRSSPGHPFGLASGHYVRKEQVGVGPQLTNRNSPTVVDAAYTPELNLEGIAPATFIDPDSGQVVSQDNAALESLSLLPLVHEKEMGYEGRPLSEVIDAIPALTPLDLAESLPLALESWIAGRSYPELFEEAFGTPDVDAVRVAQALASYQRILVTPGGVPYERYLGGEQNALTPLERQGLFVFTNVAHCAQCHLPGPRLTDDLYHNTGTDAWDDDEGRRRVTGLQDDLGKFRTRSLRHIGYTAPYFHDGSADTLDEVLAFYERGGDYDVPNKDPLIVPFTLSGADRTALLAFLEGALTAPELAAGAPPFDRPTLYSESTRFPVEHGAPTMGGSGQEPRIVIVEPPRLGDTLTIAMQGGVPGGPAALLVGPTLAPQGYAYHGAQLYVQLAAGTQMLRAELTDDGTPDGWTSLRWPVPANPVLAGTQLHAQWIVRDPHAGGSLSSSAAVSMTLF
jgi:cytochrome c peroxidase